MTYDVVRITKPEVYRGSNCFLVRLGVLGDADNLVYTAAGELGEAQPHRFLFLPGLVYSKDVPAVYIWIGKSDVLANITFGPRFAEFHGCPGQTRPYLLVTRKTRFRRA